MTLGLDCVPTPTREGFRDDDDDDRTRARDEREREDAASATSASASTLRESTRGRDGDGRGDGRDANPRVRGTLGEAGEDDDDDDDGARGARRTRGLERAKDAVGGDASGEEGVHRRRGGDDWVASARAVAGSFGYRADTVG